MVSCQKGPTRHTYAWQIGPFWQDIPSMYAYWTNVVSGESRVWKSIIYGRYHAHIEISIKYVTDVLCWCEADNIFVPPHLGTGGIMFSGCPPDAANTLFPPVHGSVGPSDQPWPFFGPSIRLYIWIGFRAFLGECIEGMAWNVACGCILTSFGNNYVLVMVCWIFLLLALLWLSQTGHIWGLRELSGERLGVNVRRGSGCIFPMLCVEFCLVMMKILRGRNYVPPIKTKYL